jgi:hypothetical protein
MISFFIVINPLQGVPDTIYYGNAFNITDVVFAELAATVNEENETITLTCSSFYQGYTYIRVAYPTSASGTLAAVIRNDGFAVSVQDFWRTNTNPDIDYLRIQNRDLY